MDAFAEESHSIPDLYKYRNKRKFRNNLAEALSGCVDGNELSVIFEMFLIDDDILLRNYSRIHRSLKEELDKIGTYTIEPYESVSNELFLKKRNIILHIYCPTSNDTLKTTYGIREALSHSKHFSNIEGGSNVPIFKCFHLDTGYTLRIQTFEPYDLHNNEFVNQLKQSDSRINELMLFLKIWFKNLQIYNDGSKTKYCVLTLIIFYLQNSNPPVLASIKTIQETTQTNIINDINFGLKLRRISINPNQNIHQMIKGFFEFYSSLKFKEIIIAPYLGKVINKADFENKVFKYPEYETQMQMLTALPGEPQKKLKTCSPMCAQDIIFLNRNVADKISLKKVEYLMKCVTMAHKKCCVPNISIKNLYKSLLVNIDEELEHMVKPTDSFVFELIPQEDELKSLAIFADQPLKIRKLWTKAYIVAIPQIITAVFKIDMTLIPPTKNCKFKKLDETEELPLPFKWSISSTVDLWSERNLLRRNACFMKNTLKLTEDLYAARRDKEQFSVKLNGFINITITKNFSSLLIEMSYETRYQHNDKCLRAFFNAFNNFMHSYNLKNRIYQLASQLQIR